MVCKDLETKEEQGSPAPKDWIPEVGGWGRGACTRLNMALEELQTHRLCSDAKGASS